MEDIPAGVPNIHINSRPSIGTGDALCSRETSQDALMDGCKGQPALHTHYWGIIPCNECLMKVKGATRETDIDSPLSGYWANASDADRTLNQSWAAASCFFRSKRSDTRTGELLKSSKFRTNLEKDELIHSELLPMAKETCRNTVHAKSDHTLYTTPQIMYKSILPTNVCRKEEKHWIQPENTSFPGGKLLNILSNLNYHIYSPSI